MSLKQWLRMWISSFKLEVEKEKVLTGNGVAFSNFKVHSQ